MARWLPILLLPLALACSGDDSSGLSSPVACTAGKVVSCACPGTTVQGIQTCLSDGTFGACTGCPTDPAGGQGGQGQGGKGTGGKGGKGGKAGGGQSEGGSEQGGGEQGGGEQGGSEQGGSEQGGSEQGGEGGSEQGGEGPGGAGQGGASQGGAGQGGVGGAGMSGASGQSGSAGSAPAGTCEQAAALRGVEGCEFWPTVTANPVWSIFDFAAVVANPGAEPAQVTIERGGGTVEGGAVGPGEQRVFYLPWVAELKGPDSDACGSIGSIESASVRVAQGAYRLTSTRPVSVLQFNAYEYTGSGGPPGKSWATCPGLGTCDPFNPTPLGCFSFSNDASRLLPTASQTGTYRVVTHTGQVVQTGISPGQRVGLTITATEDQTSVLVRLSATASTLAGSGVVAGKPGDTLSFVLARGEVVELFSGNTNVDLSGSLVEANRPVQVIAGAPCANVPDSNTTACDHIEEVLPPAESLGRRYLLAPPTGPNGDAPGHVVKLVGHVNGTKLTYKGTPPAGAPATLDAGQVVSLGLTTSAFGVEGDRPFAVGLFLPGGAILDPAGGAKTKGDPAQSVAIPVEQFRASYLVQAAGGYEASYADVIAPDGATVTLDGKPTEGLPTVTIGSTGYHVRRVPLPAAGGVYRLEASAPVGLQLQGYGQYTGYQYPGAAGVAPLP